jgi:hypothetical protein
MAVMENDGAYRSGGRLRQSSDVDGSSDDDDEDYEGSYSQIREKK